MDAGAAGVMITPTSTLRTEEQAVNYFEHSCETLGPDVAVVLQDYPPYLVAAVMPVPTCRELL